MLKGAEVWTRLKEELGSKKEKELFFRRDYILEVAFGGFLPYFFSAYLL